MDQQNKKSLCQLKLPLGVEVEDVKEVRFKLKNRWIDGQVASNECEVKFKPRVKPGLSLETPGKILYKAHSVDKFRQCLTRLAPNKDEPQKELGYKMSESHVLSKESDKKQTPITTAMPKQVEDIKERPLPHTSNQNVKQSAIEKKLGLEINKMFSLTPKKPLNPLKILQAFNPVAYSGQNADQVRIYTAKKHERSDSNLTNLQILNNVTQDLEILTKKVQDIRKNLETNRKDNPDHLKANIGHTFNPFIYQTPIKVAPRKPSIDQDTGLSKPRISLANMEKLIQNKTDQYKKSPAPVWGQVSPYLSKLMNTTNTESQYINVSKGLDFQKTFEPETNPENNLRRSNASQKSEKRRPGHLSKSIVFRKDITYY